MFKKSIIFVSIFLVSCSSTGIPEKLDMTILKDKSGCAFLVSHAVGDTLKLTLIRELSPNTCELITKEIKNG